MAMRTSVKGIIVPVVTPFDEREEIDEGALHVILDFLIQRGVHGLFPVGSQSEFFALTVDEKKRLIDLVPFQDDFDIIG